MDFLNKAAQQLQSGQQHDEPSKQEKEEGVSGALGALNNVLSQQQKEGEQNPQASGLMGFVNNAMGGGSKGEAKEDNLDKVPPPAGTCHFSKLSTELILSIAEYLDVATCLTLSQTCRAINNISRERVTYWYSSQFAHGLLPRVTDQSSLTAQELRSTAIKSTNIAWIWENSSPRVRRRVTLQWVCEKEQYFLPLGSRWLFRYGVSQGDTTDSTIYIYDLIGGRNVEPPIHLLPSQRLDKIVGESLASNKVMFAILFEPSPSTLIKVMAAEFEASNRGSKVSISEAYQFSIDRSAVDVVFQEGILAVVTDQTVILQKWDSPTTKRETAPNQEKIGGLFPTIFQAFETGSTIPAKRSTNGFCGLFRWQR
ncbi:hypothetical protein FRC17_001326 [Serendipita sp. 399]|nr:hypothetical protein FRC17_001326 [Serendipita sp. 399]